LETSTTTSAQVRREEVRDREDRSDDREEGGQRHEWDGDHHEQDHQRRTHDQDEQHDDRSLGRANQPRRGELDQGESVPREVIGRVIGHAIAFP
jgi:hypothetical protein